MPHKFLPFMALVLGYCAVVAWKALAQNPSPNSSASTPHWQLQDVRRMEFCSFRQCRRKHGSANAHSASSCGSGRVHPAGVP